MYSNPKQEGNRRAEGELMRGSARQVGPTRNAPVCGRTRCTQPTDGPNVFGVRRGSVAGAEHAAHEDAQALGAGGQGGSGGNQSTQRTSALCNDDVTSC